MAASTTVDLPPVQRAIICDCLLDELRDMAQAIANEDMPTVPISQTNLIDARWKVERMATVIGLLEDLAFIPPRDCGHGYAGSLVDDSGTVGSTAAGGNLSLSRERASFDHSC